MAADKKPADLDVSTKEMESWFGMLDDTSKAEVMKAKIAADAATEQARIKETAETERTKAKDSDFTTAFFTARGFLAGFALLAVASICITTCNMAESCSKANIARVQAEHPAPTPTVQAAAPPASAAPAASGKP